MSIVTTAQFANSLKPLIGAWSNEHRDYTASYNVVLKEFIEFDFDSIGDVVYGFGGSRAIGFEEKVERYNIFLERKLDRLMHYHKRYMEQLQKK